jgi:FKBP-type peptidyl-prolyl cis-trans isomerase SlyD
MDIAKNAVVSFHYQVATLDGETVDRSEEGQPMVYLHGTSQIIPGLEEALAGRHAGEHVEAKVPPEKGYGIYDPELDLKLPLAAFPAGAKPQLEPGFRFMAEHPNKEGQEVMFTIHAIEGDDALVSGNHPLAGETLLFKVDVVAVRAATSEELHHGHAHGPGGHHHH